MPTCNQCERAEAVCTPVMVVPVRELPAPVYLQYKGGLCNNCAYAFNINKFTDWNGSWYDMVADHLRSMKKLAVNPFPNDPNFKWDEILLRPDWNPAPREECYIQYWGIQTLAAKGIAAVPADAHRRK